jgi:hypothetical protein
MKDRRYKAVTPVTDFNVSQRIRVQLIEDGHTELAVESIIEPIRDLEEDVGLLAKRVVALEQEKVKWQTESGVFRAIDSRMTKTTGTWAKRILGVLTVAAVGATLDRFIGKLLH